MSIHNHIASNAAHPRISDASRTTPDKSPTPLAANNPGRHVAMSPPAPITSTIAKTAAVAAVAEAAE